MLALLAGVAAYTVLFTMLLACAEHLAEPSALSRALAAHRVIPATRAVAAAVIASEGLLGVAGVVALLRDGGRPLTAALAGSGALLVLYVGYGLRLRFLGRSGPCGCSRLELPMTGWVVARAAILAGLALLALAWADSIVPLTRPGAQLAIVLIAAATFTLLLWHLPAAMHEHHRRGGLPGWVSRPAR
ncbi:hypothetical protein Rhe02_58720 [Rhizocola hellebori]|uniref:Methylamine utilisation protein MauE domain-containing protein n=1 Tax=Rhizocola hellebori TaxID=1392758 RepID=A0A8J3QDU8_9ACTN|nr:MauE/DoxX family redox-associated membrane protein [Rhizocola hellebori]GIH07805.1 hypothetical protein Rhe02_58720 [Rhizocola hellebori]